MWMMLHCRDIFAVPELPGTLTRQVQDAAEDLYFLKVCNINLNFRLPEKISESQAGFCTESAYVSMLKFVSFFYPHSKKEFLVYHTEKYANAFCLTFVNKAASNFSLSILNILHTFLTYLAFPMQYLKGNVLAHIKKGDILIFTQQCI